jgi:hypothetical protein
MYLTNLCTGLVDISVGQTQHSPTIHSPTIESETSKDSSATSELSSSEQTASEDADSTENSENTSSSDSESDSNSSDNSEETSDEEETSEDDTDTAKVPSDIDPSSKNCAAQNIKTASETIPSKIISIPQDTTKIPMETPIGNAPQVNWDDQGTYSAVESPTISSTHRNNPPSESKSSVSDSTMNKPDNLKSEEDVSDSLPTELAGGWGETPEPADWEWQAMPFDYMGILEEQHRTVFYEFRERDGKGEWRLPNYEGSLVKMD